MGVTHLRRCGGDASERGGANALRLPHDKPAPRTLLPIGQRSRLAADIAADAGALLPHPFTPYREGWGRGNSEWMSIPYALSPSPVWRDCSLLPACVALPLPASRPRLLFRGVAFLLSAERNA